MTPLSDIPYKYNRVWKDKLDSYNGKWIGYDRIGNPVSYDNWTYEWQAGRQLKKMTKWAAAPDRPTVYGEVSVNGTTMVAKHVRGANDAGYTLSLSNAELKVNAAGYRLENGELFVDYAQSGTKQQTLDFSYDPNGLRTQKKVSQLNASGAVTSTVTTDYILHGKLLMELRQGTDTLHFFYDAQSRPMMVKYGANHYTYLHNLQGDILAIIDTAGTKVVEYKHDAWGRPIGTTGSMATTLGKLNPFRYRGYVYDEETQLYYLRTRYYNPEWCRFVNEDSLVGKTGKLLNHNMFAYCRNAPIALRDPSGRAYEEDESGPSNFSAGDCNLAIADWSGGAAEGGGISVNAGAGASIQGDVINGCSAYLSTNQPETIIYPPNDGFAGEPQGIVLDPGTVLQRTGSLGGKFVAPAGTPGEMLSLPHDKINAPTVLIEVLAPTEAKAGLAAPWFGQPGGGMQYLLNDPIWKLIEQGNLRVK